MTINECKPGQRVRILHTVERRDRDWVGATEGVIKSIEQQKTGSWYAHGKDAKLWLQRLRLVKDDGEITLLNIDSRTEIELLGE
ncbi:MAG: hypothetical protein KAY37_03265 [Phycisphaerae bacterium]|nr:hypothetical protein [Phycisphaerae bacterium]